jgi:hypothetical protein
MADGDGMAGMAQCALQSEHRKGPPGRHRCHDVKYREASRDVRRSALRRHGLFESMRHLSIQSQPQLLTVAPRER